MSDDGFLSGFHREVQEFVAQCGLRYQEEVMFPPFRVDIYLPQFHAVVEADGSHGPDIQRDAKLGALYELHVFHVSPERFKDKQKFVILFKDFLAEAAFEAGARWERTKLRTPWL